MARCSATWFLSLIAGVGVGFSHSGCGGDRGTNPTMSKAVAGSYSGSAENTFQGTGIMKMTLAQSGGSLSGTWSVAWRGAVANGGALPGPRAGGSILVSLVAPHPQALPSLDTA